MPTNKLWLEHTERAAWESVQALRQKVAAAEERVARLAPANESWRTILEALDAARQQHCIDKQSYADVAVALLEHTSALTERVRELQAELDQAKRAQVVAGAALATRKAEPEARPASDEQLDSKLRRFMRRVERRSKMDEGRKRSAEAVLRGIERLLDELEDLPTTELGETAAELGLYAFRLDELSARERRRTRAENEVGGWGGSARPEDDLE